MRHRLTVCDALEPFEVTPLQTGINEGLRYIHIN